MSCANTTSSSSTSTVAASSALGGVSTSSSSSSSVHSRLALADEDHPTCETIDRTIIVVGPSGSGKSQLINSIRFYNRKADAKVEASPDAVTREILLPLTNVQLDMNGAKFNLKFFDTRGLSDSAYSFLAHVDTWVKMIKTYINEVHFVIFVIPLDRLHTSLVTELTFMTQRFEEWGMKKEHVLLVLNKCDFWSNDVIEGYHRKLKQQPATAADRMVSLPSIIASATVIRGCFIDENLMDQSAEFAPVRKLSSRLMRNAANELRKIICAKELPEKPFLPKSEIISFEERAALKEKADWEQKLLSKKMCTVL